MGPRDIDEDCVFVARRDKDPREKYSEKKDVLIEGIVALLDDIQNNLFNRAQEYRALHTRDIDDWDEFIAFFTAKNGHGS